MKLQLVIIFIVFLFVESAPISNISSTNLKEPQNRVGIVDFFTLIPGVSKNEICSMCKRILSTFKKQGMARANQDQTQFRAFFDHECHVLTSTSTKYLPIDSLEPFCREFANSLMDLGSTYSNLFIGFVEPAAHCETATFCASRDDE